MAITGLAAWRAAAVIASLIASLALIQGCVSSSSTQPADGPDYDYVRLATSQLPMPGGRRPGEKLGRQHLHAGNFGESVRYLTLALESKPATTEAERAYLLRFRALALAGAGQEAAALRDIDEAVSIWRTRYGYANQMYLETRGWVKLKAGKPQQVVDDLQALGLPGPNGAETGKRGHPLRHFMRGLAYRELGKSILAEKDFGKTMEGAPDTLAYASMWVTGVREAFAAAGGNPEDGTTKAQRLLDKTRQLENAPRIFHAIALLLAKASQTEAALYMFDVSIQEGGRERLLKYQARLKLEGYFAGPVTGEPATVEETLTALRRCLAEGCSLRPPL